MWVYNAADASNDYLEHYGVKGMKWGIHRATKKLAKATTREQADKATARLEKHRTKITKKIAKLEKKQPKLEKALENRELKTQKQAATYRRKSAQNDIAAARLESKAYRQNLYGSAVRNRRLERATRYAADARMYEAKADSIRYRTEEIQAALRQNKKYVELYNRGLNDIDSALKTYGKAYMRNAKAAQRSSRKK